MRVTTKTRTVTKVTNTVDRSMFVFVVTVVTFVVQE
jgi:hypothetical protein